MNQQQKNQFSEVRIKNLFIHSLKSPFVGFSLSSLHFRVFTPALMLSLLQSHPCNRCFDDPSALRSPDTHSLPTRCWYLLWLTTIPKMLSFSTLFRKVWLSSFRSLSKVRRLQRLEVAAFQRARMVQKWRDYATSIGGNTKSSKMFALNSSRQVPKGVDQLEDRYCWSQTVIAEIWWDISVCTFIRTVGSDMVSLLFSIH